MKAIYLTFLAVIYYGFSFAQLTATFTTSVNTNCNGTDCNYTGPSILINELMISPVINDGTISGAGGSQNGRGEWIELYNPNLCEPVDISCYYLGNNTPDGAGGFIIPQGTIVPPAGFAMIRGVNVDPVNPTLLVENGGNVVEVVVPANVYLPFPNQNTWTESVCSGGQRLWFPNLGGWFAFYDDQGIPQDAVSWGNSDAVGLSPCVPVSGSCNTGVGALASYSTIFADRKTYVNDDDASTHLGLTLHRSVDGGPWAVNSPGSPTYAVCNGPCFSPGTSSCTGSATVIVSGGTAPYTYEWDDSQGQLTATAEELCDGEYCVTITDAMGLQLTECVTIVNAIPVISYTIQEEICADATELALLPGTAPSPGPDDVSVFTGTGVTGTNFDASAAGTGTHTITYSYTDEFGCANTATDEILVNPLPDGAINNILSPYCFSNNQVTFTLLPAGGTLTGAGVQNNVFTPSLAGAGTHTLTYFFTDENGCSNTTTAPVTVLANPTPAMSFADSVCISEPVIVLSASPPGGVFTVDSDPSATFSAQQEGAGFHYITYVYTAPDGCIGFGLDSIFVHPSVSLSTDLLPNYCEGTASATLSPAPAGGVLTGDFVSGTNLDFTGSVPGSYGIAYTYTDEHDCTQTLDESYTISEALNPQFDYSVNCLQIASFFNQTTPAIGTTAYAWDFGNGTNSAVANPAAPYPVAGNYVVSLTATDTYNCVYSISNPIYIKPSLSISDLIVANVITANGDGINDNISFPADFLECYEYKMYILNRWGNVVYEMSNSNNVFTGKDKSGDVLEEGVYFYTIDSPDINCEDELWKPICSGFITVVH